MNRDKIYEKVNAVFQEVFDDESITVDDKTTALDIDDWDSYEQINLVAAIEETFGIRFGLDEVGFRDVGEMVDVIVSKIGQN